MKSLLTGISPSIINASVDIQGTVTIDSGLVLQLNRGGDLSRSTLQVNPSAALNLNGDAARLSS